MSRPGHDERPSPGDDPLLSELPTCLSCPDKVTRVPDWLSCPTTLKALPLQLAPRCSHWYQPCISCERFNRGVVIEQTLGLQHPT